MTADDVERDRATGTSFRRARWLAACAIPAVVALGFVATFGVNVPHFDEWDLAPVVVRTARGSVTFADYWRQHDAHRLFFSKLILSRLAILTNWNVRIELALNVAVAALGLIGLLVLSNRSVRPRADRWLADLTTACLVFSLVQYETWLSGWDLSWFLVDTSVIWAIALLSFRPNGTLRFLAIPAILCVVASFSMAHGLGSWLACLPSVATAFPKERRRRALALWTAMFAATVAVFLIGYQWRGASLGGNPVIRLAHFAVFVFALIGGSLSRLPWIASALGLLLIAVFAVSVARLWRQAPAIAAPWTSLALFVILAAGANSLGRSGYGIAQAMTSRYTTTTNLFLVAFLYVLLSRASSSRPGDIRWFRSAAFLFLAATVVGSLSAIPLARDERRIRRECLACIEGALVSAPSSSTCKAGSYWSEDVLMKRLRDLHDSGVRRLPTAASFLPLEGLGSIDPSRSGREPFGLRGSHVMIRGRLDLPTTVSLVGLDVDDSHELVASEVVEGNGSGPTGWSIEVPAPWPHRYGAVVHAWIYDLNARGFRRLKGSFVIPAPAPVSTDGVAPPNATPARTAAPTR